MTINKAELVLRRLGDGAYNLIMGMCAVSCGGAIPILAEGGNVLLTVAVTVTGGFALILMTSNIAKRPNLLVEER